MPKHISCLLFVAWALLGGIAYADFVISLREIPEWAPGRPLQIRHITIDGEGIGEVVVVNEDEEQSRVLQTAVFEYDTDNFVHWMDDHKNYKDFYGDNENRNGRIVEGNPKTVALSFFDSGRFMKSIVLRNMFAYSDNSDERFHLPKALITLRDRLLAYAKQAKSQPAKSYYATVVPYSDNQKYWLLRSTKLESIPLLIDMANEKDKAFLDELVGGAPAFLPLGEERFFRLMKDLRFSDNQSRGVFRISKRSDTIVEIRFVRSNTP